MSQIDSTLMNIAYVRPALNAFRVAAAFTVTTVDVIKAVTGSFASDVGMDVQASDNAAFGRFLARNAAALGIEKLAAEVRVDNGLGGVTTSAVWKLGAATIAAGHA
jgi:phosphate-selective porin